MDDNPRLWQNLMDPASVPLPRPDPRGPVVSYGQPTANFRDIGSDGLEVIRGPQPQQTPPVETPHQFSDHALAALRMIFEGVKYREMMTKAGERDPTGYYDKPSK